MSTGRFQILSLDGGGLRGIFTAAVLAHLEEDHGVRIADHFDLIAGTSTGGIIALGLGLGMSPRQILEFYIEHGHRIFRDRSRLRGAQHWVLSKYSAGPLRDALTAVLGDQLFGESTKRLVIPSYDVGANDVHLFRTPHLPHLRRDWRERAVDVALATTAAPTYFPTMSLRGARLIDGGVLANNPVMVALTEAIGPLQRVATDIKAFSIGTTTDVPRHRRRLDRGGRLMWAPAAVDVLMRAQSDSATSQARHFLGENAFLRLNPTVPTGALNLDKVHADDLIGLAGHVSRLQSPEFRDRFAGHFAPAYIPCHPTSKD
ncbi:patatin [Mycobacterium intracellulare subsp. chimaera]|nr:patatin [Mycobacterium intracellulare subsp. chimaera]ASQ89198.1 patatin [Mycobacterium intracellulare subsp. chimaera]MCA2311282.1 patatin-like phospholipase family protein [Mycobacterium intracellulare subsp. chimaera]MCA2353821.1 patatin-like phospholipase family protein [Mycobacterium intracellulare subsp. chimaera]MCV7325119.1 patatin-like phospholipase family protein [Mycobacterium intracellulare subsp. chimaera]